MSGAVVLAAQLRAILSSPRRLALALAGLRADTVVSTSAVLGTVVNLGAVVAGEARVARAETAAEVASAIARAAAGAEFLLARAASIAVLALADTDKSVVLGLVNVDVLASSMSGINTLAVAVAILLALHLLGAVGATIAGLALAAIVHVLAIV